MKKILLLTFVGTLFATGSAFGHCGTCGTGDEAECHAKKACCSEKAGECCKEGKKSKSECKKEHCDKPCCAKEKAEGAEDAADETAAAKTGSCCAAKKAGAPA